MQGQATPGFQADACTTEATAPLQYAGVSIGATSVFADANGNFSIPNQSGSVTITSTLAGRYFRVLNAASGNSTPSASATGSV
ncbi:MAG: hypothetical protein ACK55I_49400, partial [bacterium]